MLTPPAVYREINRHPAVYKIQSVLYLTLEKVTSEPDLLAKKVLGVSCQFHKHKVVLQCSLSLIRNASSDSLMKALTWRTVLSSASGKPSISKLNDDFAIPSNDERRFLYLPLRGKRVVLVERHLVSLAQKRMLARVLFTYHQVSSSLCISHEKISI